MERQMLDRQKVPNSEMSSRLFILNKANFKLQLLHFFFWIHLGVNKTRPTSHIISLTPVLREHSMVIKSNSWLILTITLKAELATKSFFIIWKKRMIASTSKFYASQRNFKIAAGRFRFIFHQKIFLPTNQTKNRSNAPKNDSHCSN